MAWVVYREGTGTVSRGVECESKRIAAKSKALEEALADGWVANPLDLVPAAPVEKPIHWKTQIRQEAKAAGIEDWKTAKIEVLKGKLDHGNTEG